MGADIISTHNTNAINSKMKYETKFSVGKVPGFFVFGLLSIELSSKYE